MQSRPRNNSRFYQLTYRHPDRPPNLQKQILGDNLPILSPPTRRTYVREPPGVDLGDLEVLPTELLQHVLLQFDVRSITNFLYVNRLARRNVEAIPEYQQVITNARDALRGILAIQTGRWVSFELLYRKLCTVECDECGDFGGYLYLITCKRVCYCCFVEVRLYRPRVPYMASRTFGISQDIIDTLPHMISVPGTYWVGFAKQPQLLESCKLIDADSAYCAGIALHGSTQAMTQYGWNSMYKLTEGRDRTQIREVHRSLAIVRIPVLNRANRDREYTIDSFKKHLLECGDVREGTHYGDNYEDILDRSRTSGFTYSGRLRQ